MFRKLTASIAILFVATNCVFAGNPADTTVNLRYFSPYVMVAEDGVSRFVWVTVNPSKNLALSAMHWENDDTKIDEISIAQYLDKDKKSQYGLAYDKVNKSYSTTVMLDHKSGKWGVGTVTNLKDGFGKSELGARYTSSHLTYFYNGMSGRKPAIGLTWVNCSNTGFDIAIKNETLRCNLYRTYGNITPQIRSESKSGKTTLGFDLIISF